MPILTLSISRPPNPNSPPYDQEHAIIYMRMLDADAARVGCAGAQVFTFSPQGEP